MSEMLVALQMVPALLTGTVFFVLGLVIGSFSSVLQHRLPRREDWVVARSHCPHCSHVLPAQDLVPVLSYLVLRGHCRYCHERIPFRYPLFELSAGILAGLSGGIGGWGVGLGCLSLWVIGHAVWGLSKRRLMSRETGFALVEVLVSSVMLAAVSLSVFQFIKVLMRTDRLARDRTVMVGMAREGLARAASRALNTGADPAQSWRNGVYTVTVSDAGLTTVGSNTVWQVVVSVQRDPDAVNPSPPTISLTGVVTSGP